MGICILTTTLWVLFNQMDGEYRFRNGVLAVLTSVVLFFWTRW